LGPQTLANRALDELRTKIVDSAAIVKTIALLKDYDSDVRSSAIKAVDGLVAYGMNCMYTKNTG
jgi:hypothetical protein